MRFGINSLNFTDTFLESDLPLFDKCRALGFDVLEVTPVDPDRFPARKVRTRPKRGHVGEHELRASRETNPLSPDPKVRARSVELSKQVVDLCVEAGAEIYCGANYCAWKYFTGRPRTADEWRWGVECYRDVCEYARPPPRSCSPSRR